MRPATPEPEGGPFTPARHNTDAGNAQRLVDAHGEDLRYCHPWRRWLAWDGQRWATDETGAVMRMAKATTREMYAAAAACDNDADRKSLGAWARQTESRKHLDAIVALAQSEPGIPILPVDMDADPWLLNVTNGTIDLRTGALREHRRDDRITKRAGTEG